ncbi:MAG: hypothetical protein RRA51_01240 [Armatimonadota bacterium]|nr:hypothetical protein [Armatimonadota bacterium]
MGRGAWDEGREKWEGEANAEPKLIGKSAGRQVGKRTAAEWRLAISDW